jgi:H+/Cl- antiporter ClcA
MLREAGFASLANAVINGWSSWSKFSGQDRLSLTVDSISGGSGTVLGQAIAGVFFMALAVTGVTFYTFRRAARKHGVGLRKDLRFWPKFPTMMVKNSLFLFGLLVLLAILLHRVFGEIVVGRPTAALVVAGLAIVVTLYCALTSMREMVTDPRS